MPNPLRERATTARSFSLVVNGTDPESLADLIEMHAPRNPRILDVTYGSGTIWQGVPWQPEVRVDVRPLPNVDYVGDFRDLRHLAYPSRPADRCLYLPDEHFGVVVFDPPHIPEAGKKSRHAERFGLLADDSLAHAADITHLFEPALCEAKRVLAPGGVVLVKVINIVHRGVYRHQVAAFVQACTKVGLRLCQQRAIGHMPMSKSERAAMLRLKALALAAGELEGVALLNRLTPPEGSRAHTLRGHNWKKQHHLRCNDVYWLVARKGGCYRRAA